MSEPADAAARLVTYGPGDFVKDKGSRGDTDTNGFLLLEEGYVDLDNYVYCTDQEGDAPWTSEWFYRLPSLKDRGGDE